MKINFLVLRVTVIVTIILAVITAVAWAEPQEVRIASHVSQFSPLHAQSMLFDQ